MLGLHISQTLGVLHSVLGDFGAEVKLDVVCDILEVQPFWDFALDLYEVYRVVGVFLQRASHVGQVCISS